MKTPMVNLKKGVHCLCKFNGDNGDLIVGRVESTRSNGSIIITNLLTESLSTKSIEVFSIRNILVSKSDALTVVREFNETAGDAHAKRTAARKVAVRIASEYSTGKHETNGQPKPPVTSVAHELMANAKLAYSALSSEEKLAFVGWVLLRSAHA